MLCNKMFYCTVYVVQNSRAFAWVQSRRDLTEVTVSRDFRPGIFLLDSIRLDSEGLQIFINGCFFAELFTIERSYAVWLTPRSRHNTRKLPSVYSISPRSCTFAVSCTINGKYWKSRDTVSLTAVFFYWYLRTIFCFFISFCGVYFILTNCRLYFPHHF